MFGNGKGFIFWVHFEYLFLLLIYSPIIYMFLKRFLPWVAKKLNEWDARVESRQKK